MLQAKGQKILKTVHLICACCWVGGALSLCLLYFAKPSVEAGAELYGINRAIHWVDMGIVVIPGACGCLITGLIYSFATKWGFFKHRWIAIKWVLTVFCIVFGTIVLGPMEKQFLAMSHELGITALTDTTYNSIQNSHFIYGLFQKVALIFMVYLSVFRPFSRKKVHVEPEKSESSL